MELERVDVAEGDLPVHNDVYSVRFMADGISIRRYSAEGL